MSTNRERESKSSLEKYPKKGIAFFALLIFLSAGAFSIVLAATNTWDFSTSSDYTFDNAKIEFSSGQTQLKATSTPAWYSTSWTKRKAVTVTGSSGGAQTNYQVKITVLYDSDMQADFDDVRFTSSRTGYSWGCLKFRKCYD